MILEMPHLVNYFLPRAERTTTKNKRMARITVRVRVRRVKAAASQIIGCTLRKMEKTRAIIIVIEVSQIMC